MIAAIDVHYKYDSSATAAAVVFSVFSDSEAFRTYVSRIKKVETYVPGQFYKRELPCLLAILGMIEEEIDTVIIDGYVDLGGKPGLGRYLWEAQDCKKIIIGVAKKHFRGSDAVKLYRGKSRQPLFITSAGIEPLKAAGLIEQMHGNNRLPALLKLADSLSRL